MDDAHSTVSQPGDPRIVAVIPAHLASVRFPRKVLHSFAGLPMIEHVRRRALLAAGLSEVAVATCDDEIAKIITGYGGRVMMTSDTHTNGTERVAEAIAAIHCTHVVVLQADEPLLDPEDLETMVAAIKHHPFVPAWNAVGPLETSGQLDDRSMVKCVLTPAGRILFCFRRNPCLRSSFSQQKEFLKKILGLIAFTKSFLGAFLTLAPAPFEQAEFIEQSRILEHGFELRAVELASSTPSVNEPEDAAIVQERLTHDPRQRELLSRILQNTLV